MENGIPPKQGVDINTTIESLERGGSDRAEYAEYLDMLEIMEDHHIAGRMYFIPSEEGER
jgi:hypothetical protein